MVLELVLSIDLESNELLYRIQRDRRIVYVSVQDPEIIPRQDRTDGHRILPYLRKFPAWNEAWDTLWITREHHCVLNGFSPHALGSSDLVVQSCGACFNILDFETDRLSARLSSTTLNDEKAVIKIARFRHELPYLRNEILAYSLLIQSNFQPMPKFRGYVYEETQNRVIGFMMEELTGSYPSLGDLNECQAVLKQMHSIGLVHGDTNKYNWLKTEQGLKIFDFEATARIEQSEIVPSEEISELRKRLSDESGTGYYGA